MRIAGYPNYPPILELYTHLINDVCLAVDKQCATLTKITSIIPFVPPVACSRMDMAMTVMVTTCT